MASLVSSNRVLSEPLNNMFSFHHDLALKQLHKIVASKPSPLVLSLSHLLIAYSHGPNYNFAVDSGYYSTPYTGLRYNNSDHFSRQLADRHIKLASQNAPASSSSLLILMIEAISLRCTPGIPTARFGYVMLEATSKALCEIYDEEVSSAEASGTKIDPLLTFFTADSLLLLAPWSHFHYPSREPVVASLADRICSVLERGLQEHKDHLGLAHLYIHFSEMSPRYHPAQNKLLQSACTILRNASKYPHLLHMATHIDVQVGDWETSVRWNNFAIDGDIDLKKSHFSSDVSTIGTFFEGYANHDFHMGIWSCMMGGFEKEAMRLSSLWESEYFGDYSHCRGSGVDNLYSKDGFFGTVFHVLMRFGRYEEILARKFPMKKKCDKELFVATWASFCYARGIANAGLNRIAEARTELNELERIMGIRYRYDKESDILVEIEDEDEDGDDGNQSVLKDRVVHNNSVYDQCKVWRKVLIGEILYREGGYERAFAALRAGVLYDDAMKYDEPWGIMVPVRHALAGLLFEYGTLLESHDFASSKNIADAAKNAERVFLESESVYRTDLDKYPNNPWSLTGLIKCVERKNDMDELNELKRKLSVQRTSAFADFKVEASCGCVGRNSSLGRKCCNRNSYFTADALLK